MATTGRKIPKSRELKSIYIIVFFKQILYLIYNKIIKPCTNIIIIIIIIIIQMLLYKNSPISHLIHYKSNH